MHSRTKFVIPILALAGVLALVWYSSRPATYTFHDRPQNLGSTQWIDSVALSTAPQLSITRADTFNTESSGLWRIKAMSVDSTGDLYVLDSYSRAVLVFDSSGRHLARWGRSGGGPGEFTSPESIAILHDTVFVWDQLLHAFTPAGEPLYSTRTETGSGNFRMANRVLTAARGALTAVRYDPMRGSYADGRVVDTLEVQIRSSVTGTFEPILRLPGEISFQRGANFFVYPVIGGKPSLAITPSGSILYSVGEDYVIEEWRVNGSFSRFIRAAVPRTRVTKATIHRLIDRLIADANSEAAEPVPMEAARQLRSAPRASHRPVVGRIVAGPSSYVLIERLDRGGLRNDSGGKSSWDVISIDALAVIGNVVVPSGFQPFVLHNQSIYGVMTDSDDVPSIVRLTWRD